MVGRGAIVAVVFTLLLGRTAYAQPGPGPPLTMATAERVTSDYGTAVRELAESHDPGVRIAAHHRLHDLFGELGRLLSKADPGAGGPAFVDPAAAALVKRRIPAHELADVDEAARRALEECVAEVRRQHALGPKAQQCLERDQWLPWMFVPVAVTPGANDGGESESARLFERRRAALIERPADRALRIEVAATLVATSDYAEALRVLEPIRGDYAARLLRSRALYATQRIDAALGELSRAIEQAPLRPEARLTLARIIVQDRAGTTENMAAAGRHFRAALCHLTRAELVPPPTLHAELAHIEARLGEWIPSADAFPRCDVRSASETRPTEPEAGPRVARRIEPLRAAEPRLPTSGQRTHGAGCGHCAATPSRNETPLSLLLLVVPLVLRRRLWRPAIMSLMAMGCSATQPVRPAGIDDWAITQKRSTELHVALRRGSLPAARAPFLIDTGPYEAARVHASPRRYLKRHRTDSDGRWHDGHFVYHHAHIAVRPQLEHLDDLALSWRWPDRWFDRVSVVVDIDAYRIDHALHRDGTPRFRLRAGPSQSGTVFSASFATLGRGGHTPGQRWLSYDPGEHIDEQGGGAVMDVSIANLFDAWRSEPEVRALRANDWIALRISGYAVLPEDAVDAVPATRPDDHRGNVRQGQHGDDSLFEPGVELHLRRTVRVQVLASDLPRRER
jgi:hypothetical protein